MGGPLCTVGGRESNGRKCFWLQAARLRLQLQARSRISGSRTVRLPEPARLREPCLRLDVGEVRVPGDLPQEAIRIRKVARVTAPWCALRLLDDSPAVLGDMSDQPIDLGLGAHIVSQGEPGESSALSRDVGILGELVAREQRQPG